MSSTKPHFIIEVTVPAAAEPLRLDKMLNQLLLERQQEAPQTELAGLSRARLQQLIKAGQIARRSEVGKIVAVTDSSAIAKPSEIYLVTIPMPVAALPEAQKMPLEIIYEDADLLILNKPVGMVVHPAAGNRDKTLVNALLAHCGSSLSGIGGVARPGIVHRLDKDTSGLMVVAKHDAAHQALSKQFADRSLSRTYLAIVWGVPQPAVGEVAGAIGRHPRDRKKMAVVSHGGRAALTYYKLKEIYGDAASLVECKLATGRTHQIRVHMAHLKHPVAGDATYGGRTARTQAKGKREIAALLSTFPRQALHAAELRLIHPATSKPMTFKVNLPDDMAGLLKALKRTKVPLL